MQWGEPAWLALLILTPWPWLLERSRPGLRWPTLAAFGAARRRPWGAFARGLPILLLSVSIGATAVALARPRTVGGVRKVEALGVAIVVAVDRSSSMEAADFGEGPAALTRLDAAKRTVVRFLSGRPDDPVGVVAFANFPDTACPPTLDHEFARAAVLALSAASATDDGTNLGDAIAWSLDLLRKSPAASRALVLLSDGRNDPNVPRPLDPLEAARLCSAMDVRLHTVAVGSAGGQVRERDPASGLDLVAEVGGPDLALLAELARVGGGRSFQAVDPGGLARVFAAIDAMERSPVSGTVRTRYDEHAAPWAALALACLAAHRLLRSGRLARLP